MKSKFCIVLCGILMALDILAVDRVKIGYLYYALNDDYKTASVLASVTPASHSKQTYSGNITIPSSVLYNGDTYEVTQIASMAFSYCPSLYSVVIPNSVKKVSWGAFEGCPELTSVVLPANLRRIEEKTFWCCFKLESITLGNNVQYIGSDAFYSCWALTTLKIPAGVRRIEHNAFYDVNNVLYEGNAEGSPWGARNLNKTTENYLIFTDKSKTVLSSCSVHALGHINIPNGVVKISANAFENCREITSISIPNTVKYIEYGAFIGCSKLQYLTISKSVQTIEVEAFRGCRALTLKIPEKFRGELGTLECERVIYY